MSTPRPASASRRTDFLDRLRVVLTALVIAHHTAITYGGEGSWFYREVTDINQPGSLLLTLFCAVNQAFFMGLFFLLAGYFTPQALQRKGPRRFLLDRALRLGVPLLLFGWVLGPFTVALGAWAQDRAARGLLEGFLHAWTFVMGPLWFVLALLAFTVLWVTWAVCTARPRVCDPGLVPLVPAWPAWALSAVVVGAVAWTLRLWMPVGKSVLGIQPGYFASYVFLFFLGCHAARGQWLERVTRQQARGWGGVALIAIPVLPVCAAWAGALQGAAVDFNGRPGLPALVYAFWEPLVAWGVMAWLLFTFRQRFNGFSRRWRRWGDQAYTAFIVHAPVVVALAGLMAPWSAHPLLKFLVVTCAGTGLSFLLANALQQLPRRVRTRPDA